MTKVTCFPRKPWTWEFQPSIVTARQLWKITCLTLC
jgi:hypothetical protein